MDNLSIEPLAGHPKYEKIRDLDKGAFGWVQHARNQQTGEEVAVKFIELGQRFYQKYVEREIINHRLLAHPHIVGFKEVFHLAIVMEYVGGGNLQQYVEAAGRLPEWQARCFFQQLILALQYCHASLHIAHRDIKLGNVLLNTKYQIPILKLCDWGYSKSTQWGSTPRTRVGTAAYISPEVARSRGDKGYDTEKADVWSAGVTLYCMLAGRYPFMDVDQQVRLKKIQDLSPVDVEAALGKLPSDVSPDCVALLRRIFAIEPAQRPSLTDLMADVWFRQFLPDLSKLAVAQPRVQQSVEDITAILQDAERLSRARQAQRDEFDNELMEDAELEDALDDQ
ncbi:sulfur stress regulator [Micractinium conductrix]|uniref:Sulfur stress regulator n=1 Tax=Micractinium conductrix TaxID=554055 RepID=A0A2P6VFJ8_9CHLO|nr:sulfur stress regulator [Micractinium conductrix]|eukprot:PSC72848.1 sulfur stress regulator [Micractinium conductrix]